MNDLNQNLDTTENVELKEVNSITEEENTNESVEIKDDSEKDKKESLKMNVFERTIWQYVVDVASKDTELKKKLDDPKKDIHKCCATIMNKIREKCKEKNMMAVPENVIYGLAIDYYDEPEGTYNEKMNQRCEVIVGKEVELTPEEIKEVKEKAKKRLEQEQYEAMKKLPGQKKQDKVSVITVVLNQNYYRYIPDTKELKKNGTLVLKQDYNEQDKTASMLAYAEWKYGTNTEYKNLMQKNILDLRAHGNCFNEEKPYLDR